ncbi:hypothetical protein RDV89_13715 [Nocardioides zeae]|uniref:EVE domain-containing protein n=1 Tax=Nocardioides imazamoxiresistens TaxID=3231893 RepID=A0ABU3PZD7_9ACTN|nr:hypothetical protein [Nocardioides zeae]MDT9594135.1 hypothetical protein [Nocardioides zeae]
MEQTTTTDAPRLRLVREAAAHWVCVISRGDAHLAQQEGRLRLPASSEARARRLSAGDGVLLYSPREGNRSGPRVRRFTAVGRVRDDGAYQVDGDVHRSWCRDVDFEEIEGEAEAEPLIERLSFVRPGPGWGVVFRPGFVAVQADDFEVVRGCLVGG